MDNIGECGAAQKIRNVQRYANLVDLLSTLQSKLHKIGLVIVQNESSKVIFSHPQDLDHDVEIKKIQVLACNLENDARVGLVFQRCARCVPPSGYDRYRCVCVCLWKSVFTASNRSLFEDVKWVV